MHFEVKAELVQSREVMRAERESTGPRDEDRIAIGALEVGKEIGIAPACSIRPQQRDTVGRPAVVELIEVARAKSVAKTKFYHRVNSATAALGAEKKGNGERKYSLQTVMYPAASAYEATDHEQVIAMLKSAGFVEQTDDELLDKLIPVAIVKRIA